LRSLELKNLGAGRHQVDLAAGGRLRPGLYLLRMTHAGRSLNARAVVLR